MVPFVLNVMIQSNGPVAELVDARDLKSLDYFWSCGFESLLGYHGDMVERVDTLVSKTSSLIESVGSSPSIATTYKN